MKTAERDKFQIQKNSSSDVILWIPEQVMEPAKVDVHIWRFRLFQIFKIRNILKRQDQLNFPEKTMTNIWNVYSVTLVFHLVQLLSLSPWPDWVSKQFWVYAKKRFYEQAFLKVAVSIKVTDQNVEDNEHLDKASTKVVIFSTKYKSEVFLLFFVSQFCQKRCSMVKNKAVCLFRVPV